MVIVNDRRVPMKLSGWKNIRLAILSAVCFCLSAGMTFAAAADAGQITDGHKAKVKGVIISRSGNLVKIQDQKSGTVDVIKSGGEHEDRARQGILQSDGYGRQSAGAGPDH